MSSAALPLRPLSLDGSSVLVTGATGSFGKAFVRTVLEHCPNIKRLVVFSRDELKQFEMSQVFDTKLYPIIRYFHCELALRLEERSRTYVSV